MANGYLIGEEGPLAGHIVRFEEGGEWVLGRDPDEAGIVLEDSMVSRRHVICTLTPEGFTLENLSSVNPATQNGKVITESVLLREGDIIQIGNTYFRFTEKSPEPEEKLAVEEEIFQEGGDFASFALPTRAGDTRWMLKVISGPNAGAEFSIAPKATLIIGKDPNSCDLVFQDLSVSRQHARLSVDEEGQVFIEDLGSRNGVVLNGEKIEAPHQLVSQDLLSFGTTSVLLIDRQQERETIVTAPMVFAKKEAPKEELKEEAPALKEDWKELVISKKHLIIAGSLGVMALVIVFGAFTLFQTAKLPLPEKGTYEEVQEVVHGYPSVQFSYNSMTGKLFLAGHVLTALDKQELLYLIEKIPDVKQLEDNVIIDEYVWQSLNALLLTNPKWIGISVHSASPGRFVISGYIKALPEYQLLLDYINVHFPYLDRMENDVVVESNLNTQIQSLLIQLGFSGVTFQLSNGEVILSGRVDETSAPKFQDSVTELKRLKGVRDLKNYVIYTTEDTSRIDLSGKYRVGGVAMQNRSNSYVLVNGAILAVGGELDGMEITEILPDTILLEKDGIKFRIHYNPQ